MFSGVQAVCTHSRLAEWSPSRRNPGQFLPPAFLPNSRVKTSPGPNCAMPSGHLRLLAVQPQCPRLEDQTHQSGWCRRQFGQQRAPASCREGQGARGAAPSTHHTSYHTSFPQHPEECFSSKFCGARTALPPSPLQQCPSQT